MALMNTDTMIHYADSDQKIMHCLHVIRDLRPNINEENILAITHKMLKQDYHIIYVESNGKPVAFSGFRYITHYYSGDIIYIDDLGTLPEARGRGFGGILLDHIISLAREKGLDGVHLDSGHHRFDAHRLYLNKGFKIGSHHFTMQFEK